MQATTLIRDLMQSSGVQFGTSGIRGLVDALTDENCFAFTWAFLEQVAPHAREVVIGHDLRPSSPRMTAACAAAAQARGCRVHYAGVLPTPALAWFAQEHAMAAIMVTGSHIPFDRNGLKFYRVDGEISKADESAITSAPAPNWAGATSTALPACDTSIAAFYAKRYLQAFAAGALQGMRVGFYEHSSAGRDIFTHVLQNLGADVISLGRTDHFVPIDTEAVSAEDRQLALRWAESMALDAIISTDGDADRPLIGDESGHWLRGDVVGILCARALGIAQVVAPVNCLSSLESCNSFSPVVRTRIGSPYVIEGMEQLQASGKSFAGFEANGGFLLGCELQLGTSNLKALPTRDALLPILALLCAARQAGQTLSQLAATLPPRHATSDRLTGFAPARSAALLAALKKDPDLVRALMSPDAKSIVASNEVDGLRVQFDNGDIVHVRPSGNAPEFRCIAESTSVQKAQELCDQCLQRIAALPSPLPV